MIIDVGYQLTRDIDWFCIINDYPVHVASNGGRLPNFIRSDKQLFASQKNVLSLPNVFDYEVNREIELDRDEELESLEGDFNEYFPEANEVLGDNQFNNTQKAYYWSFVSMAKKGFYSFDKVILGEFDSRYRLVAWPKFIYKKKLPCPCIKRVLCSISDNNNRFNIASIDMSEIPKNSCIDLVDKINEAYSR